MHVEYGSSVDVFSRLQSELGDSIKIFSHEETGNWISYQRDIKIKQWCRSSGVSWFEFSQHGVQRPLKSRDGWSMNGTSP